MFEISLEESPNLLCLVITNPNFTNRSLTVLNTWGKRCTYIRFITTKPEPLLPTIVTSGREGYDSIWGKTKQGFKIAYEEFLDKVDWVLKADDDTYIIMENLNYLLSFYNHNFPIWLGCALKVANVGSDGLEEYMMGGAGYILSKEAVIRFNEASLKNTTICVEEDDGAEDVNMGKCLQYAGVLNKNSTDEFGRYLFLPFFLHSGIGREDWTSYGSWFWNYLEHKERVGFDFASRRLVSLHYVTSEMMQMLDYLLYDLQLIRT